MVRIAYITALLGSALASPGVTPPNTAFTATGGMTIVRNDIFGNSDIWVCNLSLSMNTGVPSNTNASIASTGSLVSGTAIGQNCGDFAFNGPMYAPTTYSITSVTASGGNASLHGLKIMKGGSEYCFGYTDIPFTWTNNGASPSTLEFQTGSVYGSGPTKSCFFSGKFTTSVDVNAVQ